MQDLNGMERLFPGKRVVRFSGGHSPFADQELGWVFSNAVVEHVGGPGSSCNSSTRCCESEGTFSLRRRTGSFRSKHLRIRFSCTGTIHFSTGGATELAEVDEIRICGCCRIAGSRNSFKIRMQRIMWSSGIDSWDLHRRSRSIATRVKHPRQQGRIQGRQGGLRRSNASQSGKARNRRNSYLDSGSNSLPKQLDAAATKTHDDLNDSLDTMPSPMPMAHSRSRRSELMFSLLWSWLP
jgi:hypothetical protein